MNRVSRSRDLSQARVNLLEAPSKRSAMRMQSRPSISLNPAARPSARKTGLDAAEFGFFRLELGPARDELVARLQKLFDAVRPFLHPRWRTRTRANVFQSSPQPCSVSASSPAARASAACAKAYFAGLLVEPLGFERVFGEARGVFDRIVRQKIRVDSRGARTPRPARRATPVAEPPARRISPPRNGRHAVSRRVRASAMRSAVARGRPAASRARREVVSAISFSTASRSLAASRARREPASKASEK